MRKEIKIKPFGICAFDLYVAGRVVNVFIHSPYLCSRDEHSLSGEPQKSNFLSGPATERGGEGKELFYGFPMARLINI